MANLFNGLLVQTLAKVLDLGFDALTVWCIEL